MSKDRGEKAPLILPLDPAPWTPSAQPSLDDVGGGDAGVYGEPSITEGTLSLLILAQPREGEAVILSLVQRRKLRHREVACPRSCSQSEMGRG